MPAQSHFVPLSALTGEAFAPFGELVGPKNGGRSVNRGEAVRHDHVAHLVNLREASTANLAFFEVRRGRPPLSITWLERHPSSTQVFVPLSAGRFVVTVAPNDASARPDCAGAQAFLAGGGEGLTYRPGVWHHGLIPLDGAMRFAMLVWEDGSAGDCEIVDLAAPLRVGCARLV